MFFFSLLWIYHALCWILPLSTERIPYMRPRPLPLGSVWNKLITIGTIQHLNIISVKCYLLYCHVAPSSVDYSDTDIALHYYHIIIASLSYTFVL